ncbi:MAG: acetylxylan esterase, partial [Bacteroidota bacterium]
MKVQLFFCLLILNFSQIAHSQPNPEKPNLRQGKYYAESHAVEIHQQFAKTYSDKNSWQNRAQQIKEGILNGAEIDLQNRKRPDNILIHSRLELSGYAVENVSFQSLEGIYVTGNLYSPLKIKGKIPAILCPHGHGTDPRFKEYTQQRCATLARMGAYVFA